MKSLLVSTDSGKYPVVIERGCLKTLGSRLRGLGVQVFIVTDETVWSLYANEVKQALESTAVKFHVEVIPPGEQSKSGDMLFRLYSSLAKQGVTRSDYVLALGGGVVGDLAGMAAATWLRGVRFAQVPTTLLSQVDSSIGGKVAIDLPEGKNLVGAFYQPKFVLVDPDVLQTLPDREFACGMGEVIKHAAIADPILFETLERRPGRAAVSRNLPAIIRRNLAIKRTVVKQDEKDNGPRMMLNFGHTIGHAIEKAAGYTGITHGEAIAIGMCHITARSEAMGITKPGTAARLRSLCEAFGLPSVLVENKRLGLLETMALDKKTRGGSITLALLTDVGQCVLRTVPIDELEMFL